MAGTVITKKGLQLIAKLVASGTALTFTRVSVGTGSVPAGYDPGNITDLNNYKMDGSISSCSFLGDEASIIMQISSLGVETGFTITETGLFATDPDEGEILYSYLDLSKDPQYVYEENSAISKFVEMTLVVKVGTVERVTAQLNPHSLLTRDGDISDTSIEELEPIDTKYPVPSAGESAKVFLGKIKKYIEDTKPLDADMTVYVATTGSDATGSDATGDGTSSKPYKTITYALSQVPKDLGGYTATVNIADGTYNESVNITGYTGGYLYLKRNGAQELNDLCNIISISVQYCSNVSVTGFNLTNTKGTSVFANMCEFVNMAYCQSIVTTVSDEVSFNFDYVSVGRIGMCRSLNHNMCLRSYSSNVTSFSWSDDSWGTYGIFSDGGGRITKGNTFQPRGLVTNEVTPGGSIIASNYGARIGTLPADITLYVATTGSDIRGDGSSTKPFLTIKRAVDSVPKDLGGYECTITVASGTYAEDVHLNGFHSGSINLYSSTAGTLSSSCSVSSIYVTRCTGYVRINGFNLTSTTKASILIGATDSAYIYYCQSVQSAPSVDGIQCYESKVSIEVSKVTGKNRAVMASFSTVMSNAWYTSGGNGYGIYSLNGSRVIMNGVQPTGTIVSYPVDNGGMFINNSGTQIYDRGIDGLSCSWASLSGGWVRHGNPSGWAMISVQVGISTPSGSASVPANTDYYVYGFPKPVSNVAVALSPQFIASNCYIDVNGILRLRFSTPLTAPYGMLVNCTYATATGS